MTTFAYFYSSLAKLQSPAKARQTLDRAVDKLYRPRKFEDDPTRVAFLSQKN